MKAFSRPGFAAGPCLLKDTLQLAAFCNNTFFMGHAAMLVNEGLPNAIVAELREGDVERQCVAILGMAFKGDSDDKRESLSYRLRNLLSLYAKEVICTDPYVCDPTLVPLDVALEKADLIVLGAPHTVCRNLRLPPTVKAFLAGWPIVEAPTTWRDRTRGESRFHLYAWLPRYLKWYLFAFRPRHTQPPCPGIHAVRKHVPPHPYRARRQPCAMPRIEHLRRTQKVPKVHIDESIRVRHAEIGRGIELRTCA